MNIHPKERKNHLLKKKIIKTTVLLPTACISAMELCDTGHCTHYKLMRVSSATAQIDRTKINQWILQKTAYVVLK